VRFCSFVFPVVDAYAVSVDAANACVDVDGAGVLKKKEVVEGMGWIAKSTYFLIPYVEESTNVGTPPRSTSRTVLSSSAGLSCDQPSLGSLTWCHSCVVIGADPGMTWMDASGMVSCDHSR
jgi:hypothetical protein